ncbi:MAG TPA: hypothetical protein VGI82_14255, partial [Chitinophagaceae bacterium]
MLLNGEYSIGNAIEIKNRQDGAVKVFFSTDLNKQQWDFIKHLFNGSDERLFYWVSHSISGNVRFQLNNPLSFQP